MPRTNLQGDDPFFELSNEEKDREERKLREEARADLVAHRPLMPNARRAGQRISRAALIRTDMREFAAEYRRLLMADESVASLDASLRLLDRLLASFENPNLPSLKREFAFIAHDSAKYGGESSARSQRTILALTSLPTLLDKEPALVSESEYSRVLDVLMLIFHHAYYGLLPKLIGKQRVRNTLLDAFEKFAAHVPGAGDRFQVAGLVHAAKGKVNLAIEDFRASLAAAHTDDHDFMSTLQLVWLYLVDERRYMEAHTLLLKILPRVSLADLDEMNSLLHQTFQTALDARSSKPGKKAAMV